MTRVLRIAGHVSTTLYAVLCCMHCSAFSFESEHPFYIPSISVSCSDVFSPNIALK